MHHHQSSPTRYIPMMSRTNPSAQTLALQDQLEQLEHYVKQSAITGEAIHQVETGIWHRVLELGYQAMGMYLSLQGDGDMGETLALENGEIVYRLPSVRHREYQSVFGDFSLERPVYGSREGQKILFVPLDSRLQLPESKFSYLLQDWDQSLVVENPFAQVNATISRILGFKQSSDSLERMNRQMSESVSAFEAVCPAPPLASSEQIIVASGDGKGVPIRHPADTPAIAEHRQKRGPKPNRKKMATVGAVYTIEPRVRTPEEVLNSLFRDPTQAPPATSPPQAIPQAKRVKARLNLDSADACSFPRATDQLFEWLASQVQQRQSNASVRVIALMDGQLSLWQAAQSYLSQLNYIEILDLLHVTSRVWSVAALWCKPQSEEAIRVVKAFVSLILQGKVKQVITVWRLLADSGGFKPKQRKRLKKICQYFENNQHRMRYDQYLAAGYPIASGVIEGACRHFVKDRMERAGMQWTIQGAQAMLDIRSVALNDTWSEFNQFRIQRETERLYPHRNLLGTIDWPFLA